MSETRIRLCDPEEVNRATLALHELLGLTFEATKAPLLSIAAAVVMHCREVPTLGEMLRMMLDGKSADDVMDATAIPADAVHGMTNHAPGGEA